MKRYMEIYFWDVILTAVETRKLRPRKPKEADAIFSIRNENLKEQVIRLYSLR